MTINENIVNKAKKKALQSICRYKISATGFNAGGECVASTFNRPRFMKQGGGIHAEMSLMQQAKRKGIRTIVICRVNPNGNLMPISPCKVCNEKAKELGIKIVTIA